MCLHTGRGTAPRAQGGVSRKRPSLRVSAVAPGLLDVAGMNVLATTMPVPPPASGAVGYHGAVSEFKRRLIEATLHQVRGNRTHAARALGLQRTYLLRLIRELGVTAPPAPVRRADLTGGLDGTAKPPDARTAPAKPWRSSTSRSDSLPGLR